MVNFIHCPECSISSEIKTDSNEEMKEPIFCPFCGYFEERDLEESDEEYNDYDY